MAQQSHKSYWLVLTACMGVLLSACDRSPTEEPDPGPGSGDEPRPPVSTTLSAPTDTRVDIGNGQLLLHWTAVEGADAYAVYVSPASAEDFPEAAQIIASDGSPHAVSGLDNGVNYQLAVAAAEGDAVSAPGSTVSATPVPGLNDTGINWCVDGEGETLSCDQTQLAGQDGSGGRDALSLAGSLNKSGAGGAGFDFSKVDAQGQVLSESVGESADTWHCVQDNHTGLLWEVKTTDEGLHDAAHRYTWYVGDLQGEEQWEGVQDGGVCSGSECDTSAYVQAVNAQGLCGHHDWRLPSRSELLSISHSGQANPGIDRSHFPQAEDGWYWSANAFIPDASLAWALGLQYGHTYPQGKDSAHAVRLVRGGNRAVAPPDACPASDYQIEDDRVTDPATGLTWQRCSLGQSWSGSECLDEAETLNWEEALALSGDPEAMPASPLGSLYDEGWRLPNQKELASLLNGLCPEVAIDDVAFPGTAAGRYWTSSPFADYGLAAWVVDFSGGAIHDSARTNRHYVRLVRGQP